MSDGSARDWTCSKPLISDSTPTTAHNLILCRKPFSETIFLPWCDQNSSSAEERTGRWLGDACGCAWCEAAGLRKPITDNFCGKRSRNFPQSLAYHSGILGSERPGAPRGSCKEILLCDWSKRGIFYTKGHRSHRIISHVLCIVIYLLTLCNPLFPPGQ